MCGDVNLDSMPRALLTERERDVVSNDEDIPRSTRSTLLSRVEQKIGIMREDARLLRENQPQLAEDLHEAVCEEDIDERIECLKTELESTKSRVGALEQELEGCN
jgi:hypothetical protein